MNSRSKLLAFFAVVTLLGAGAPTAQGHTIVFYDAELTASQVVTGGEAKAGQGSSGSVALMFSPDDNPPGRFAGYSITLTGLDLDGSMTPTIPGDDVTSIRFRIAAAGAVGPHALNVFGQVDGVTREDDSNMSASITSGVVSGVWQDADETLTGPDGVRLPMDSIALVDAISDLFVGRIYLEVATARCPEGELRGQLIARSPAIVPLRLDNGAFQLTFAPGGARWLRLESSADLRQWTPLTNIVTSTGVVRVLDSGAVGAPRRYYRIREEILVHPRFVTEPADQTIASGGELRLVAEAVGNPPVAYFWQRDSRTIAGANESTLIIPNVGPEHAGLYRVIAGNAVGVAPSRAIWVTVEPQIGTARTGNVDARRPAPMLAQ